MCFIGKRELVAVLIITVAITLGSAKEERTTETVMLAQKREAWELQSRSVAGELKLSREETGKLTKSHADLMNAYFTDAEKIRSENQGNRMKTILALVQRNSQRREALTSRTLQFLAPEKATSATAVLGAYSEQWDDMVGTLVSFHLGEEKLFKALSYVNHFVAACDAARIDGMKSGDFGSILEAMTDNKETLDKRMAALLSKQQKETWDNKTPLPFVGRSGRGHLPLPEKPYTLPKDHPLRLVSIEVDPVHTEMLGMRENGWLGSDVGHSIILSEDKSLWLFGDTFIGPLKNGVRVAGAPMINNTIAIQDRKTSPPDCMTFYWKTTDDGKPASFFPHQEGTPGTFYWPTAGIMLRDELFIFNWCVGGNAQDAGGWGGFGTAMIRVSNPIDPPEQWKQKAYTLKLPAGSTFLSVVHVEEPYVYLYGIVKPHQSALARVRTEDLVAGKLTEAYEYWVEGPNGPHWGKEAENCVPQFSPATTEGTIHYEKELGLYTVFTYDGGPNIYLCTAPELTGPWTKPAPIYWVPEHHTLSFGIISYAVRQHPEFSTKPGEVILSYATNAPGSIRHHFTDEGKDVYVLRFLKVQLEQNTSRNARKR